jgi:hypothetical protein
MQPRKFPVVLVLSGLLGGCFNTNTRTSFAAKMPPGLDPRTAISESYARLVARDAVLWLWPTMELWNARLHAAQIAEASLQAGLPTAPLNHLAMGHAVADANGNLACPSQDVLWGCAVLALDKGPVVVQVPDFGGRCWLVQVLDARHDAFANLGAMHETAPGFYLLVGPEWEGEQPSGIQRGFRCGTNTAVVVVSVFQQASADDARAARDVIGGIDIYPLTDFDGQPKRRDWSHLPEASATDGPSTIAPASFVSALPDLLADARPLPGEEARAARLAAVLGAARQAPALQQAFTDEVGKAIEELVSPLREFRNVGVPLPHHWTTVNNGAAYGTDELTRTAVTRLGLELPRAVEMKAFFLDLDDGGQRLNGHKSYTLTFAPGDTPPVAGFWSVSLYDKAHGFVRSPSGRCAVGTFDPDLQPGTDGSLTLYIQADEPKGSKRANWLPAPRDEDFSLCLRAWWPRPPTIVGDWTPPGAVLQE